MHSQSDQGSQDPGDTQAEISSHTRHGSATPGQAELRATSNYTVSSCPNALCPPPAARRTLWPNLRPVRLRLKTERYRRTGWVSCNRRAPSAEAPRAPKGAPPISTSPPQEPPQKEYAGVQPAKGVGALHIRIKLLRHRNKYHRPD